MEENNLLQLIICFNGQIIDTFNDTLTPVDWKPELFTKIDPVNEVKENVLRNAGANNINR